MPIVSVDKDLDNHTMTVVAEYDAPVERVWQLYADPRQLERFWGPPTWPATVVDHDLSPGGRVTYFMTGPDGEKSAGYWDVLEVEAPRRFLVEDGFADDAGQPNRDMPTTRMDLRLDERAAGGTTMTNGRHLRLHRGHGEDARDGHGRGHARGDGPDRRRPRRGGLTTRLVGASQARRRRAPAGLVLMARAAPVPRSRGRCPTGCGTSPRGLDGERRHPSGPSDTRRRRSRP